MRFMILRKADKKTEAGVLPSEKLLAVMGQYMEDMGKAGVLLSGEGLQPRSKGARVKFSGGKPTVIDGPFAETQELIGGFCLIQVKSKREAIDWIKRWPALDGDGEVEIEIRQVFEAEDFGPEFTPELRESEERLRAQVEKRAKKASEGQNMNTMQKTVEPFVNKESFMQSNAQTASESKKKLWAGRVVSGMAVAFLLFDSAIKIVKAPIAVEGTVQLGYPESVVLGIGVLLLVCTLLYAIPRTSILGAILLTGYLGGAIATQVRVGNPLFTHVLFPVYVGMMIWGGLFLRDRRLRAVLSADN